MEGTTESQESSEPRQTHCHSSLRSHTGWGGVGGLRELAQLYSAKGLGVYPDPWLSPYLTNLPSSLPKPLPSSRQSDN